MPQANDNRIMPTRRQRIEETIERLISALDAADAPAEDLEPLADDADLAWPERGGVGAIGLLSPANEDEEPDLGWTGDVDQTRALRHYIRCQQTGHAEAEHDGGEPSLGSLDDEADQERWAEGDPRDIEADYAGFFHGHFWRGFVAHEEREAAHAL